jgi:hypothetical protein
MAKIWPCFDNHATVGGPWGECTIKWCEEALGLSPVDYFCTREQFVAPKDQERGLHFTHVVVEVSPDEAASYGKDWKPGIYTLRMAPADVHRKLGFAQRLTAPLARRRL